MIVCPSDCAKIGREGKSEQGSAAFQEYDADYWASKHAKIEQAAIAADPTQA